MNWQDYTALLLVIVFALGMGWRRRKKPPHCANCAPEEASKRAGGKP